MARKKLTSYNIPESTMTRLKKYCAKEGLKSTQVVNRAIEKAIKASKNPDNRMEKIALFFTLNVKNQQFMEQVYNKSIFLAEALEDYLDENQ